MSETVEEAQPEPIILDPEAVEAKVAEAVGMVVEWASRVVGSAPYGLLPDPAHMALLRDACKRYELAVGEMQVTAALIRLASDQGQETMDAAVKRLGEQSEPQDIQTEGM